jgi:hypothetical protein
MLKLNTWFGEIDWYDNMTDIYTTPMAGISRGLKRARLEYKEHGSIPKDWSFNLGVVFTDMTTSTPIMEVVKAALGSKVTKDVEKQLVKALKPLLHKEKNRIRYDFPEVEDKPYTAPRWF